MAVAVLVVLLLVAVHRCDGQGYCRRGERCWPSKRAVEQLRGRLNPEMTRVLEWKKGDPFISPLLTPRDGLEAAPLYGLGYQQLAPLYERGNLTTCREAGFASDFCKAQATNNPLRPEDPDFVVFVLTAEHVRAVVQFARRHRLCIGVAGSGHDFNGRNQPFCDGGSVLVRTTLMRSKEADLDDQASLGHPSMRFGAGIVFSEAHAFAASHGKVIASGLCESVGLVGWTLGGGHGPLTPGFGFGADNLLAVDMVLGNGRLATVTAEGPFSDLFRALKGGGGSTWGIITHITVKAHPIPPDGFTVVIGSTWGDMCEDGASRLRKVVGAWQAYNMQVTSEAMNVYVVVSNPTEGSCASSSWGVVSMSVIAGGPLHPQTEAMRRHLMQTGATPGIIPHANFYEVSKSYSMLFGENANYIQPWGADDLSGVLVQRNQTETLTDLVVDVALGRPAQQAITTSLTGNVGSPIREDNSLSPALRTALSLYLSYETAQEELTHRLGKNVYFSESSYEIDDPLAFWGDSYWELLRVKRRYDPRGVFGCRGCIGTEQSFDP